MLGFHHVILIILYTHTIEICTFSSKKCNINSLIPFYRNPGSVLLAHLDTVAVDKSDSIVKVDKLYINQVKYILIPPPNPDGHLHLGNAYDLVISDALIRAKLLQGLTVIPLFGSDSGGSKLRSQVAKSSNSNLIDDVNNSENSFCKPAKLPPLNEINKVANEWRIKQLHTMKKLSLSWVNSFNNVLSNVPKNNEINLTTTCDSEMGQLANKVFEKLKTEKYVYKSTLPCCHFMNQNKLYPLHQDMLHDQTKLCQLYTLSIPINDASIETNKSTLLIDLFEVEMIFAYAAIIVPENFDLPIKTVKIPLVNSDIPIIKGFINDPSEPFTIKGLIPNHRQKHHYFAKQNGICGISVIDYQRKMINVPEWLVGVDRFEARKILADKLIEMGVLRKKMMSERFISKDLNGEEATFLITSQYFFNNNGDYWPITRSCYYGHPVSSFDNNSNNQGCEESDSIEYICEKLVNERVFDVWYISGLWPLYIYNKIKTRNLTDFDDIHIDYLSCGRDIAKQWVSKMVSLGKIITGKNLFTNVHYHGLIMAKNGKMGKSLGNDVKVDEFIDKFGSDATRMYLLSLMDGKGEDVPPIFIDDKEFSLIHNKLRIKIINIMKYLAKQANKQSKCNCKLAELFDCATDEVYQLLATCCEKWDFATPLIELERIIMDFSRYLIPLGSNVACSTNIFVKLAKLLSVYMPLTSKLVLDNLSQLYNGNINAIVYSNNDSKNKYLTVFKCIEDIRSHLQKPASDADKITNCICKIFVGNDHMYRIFKDVEAVLNQIIKAKNGRYKSFHLEIEYKKGEFPYRINWNSN